LGLGLLLSLLDRVGGLGSGRHQVLGFLGVGPFPVDSCLWSWGLAFGLPFDLGVLRFQTDGKGSKVQKKAGIGVYYLLLPVSPALGCLSSQKTQGDRVPLDFISRNISCISTRYHMDRVGSSQFSVLSFLCFPISIF
jgi:hypothetical protein